MSCCLFSIPKPSSKAHSWRRGQKPQPYPKSHQKVIPSTTTTKNTTTGKAMESWCGKQGKKPEIQISLTFNVFAIFFAKFRPLCVMLCVVLISRLFSSLLSFRNVSFCCFVTCHTRKIKRKKIKTRERVKKVRATTQKTSHRMAFTTDNFLEISRSDSDYTSEHIKINHISNSNGTLFCLFGEWEMK